MYKIWYMKPDWFRQGIMGASPDPRNLSATHVLLKELELPGRPNLETIWVAMQGESWSPNGEARELIEAKGLAHTSMSVGDVIVSPDNKVWVAASLGFKEVK